MLARHGGIEKIETEGEGQRDYEQDNAADTGDCAEAGDFGEAL